MGDYHLQAEQQDVLRLLAQEAELTVSSFTKTGMLREKQAQGAELETALWEHSLQGIY